MPALPASFCQIHIGDIEVTFVPDGSIHGSAMDSYPGSPAELWEANGHYLDDAGLLVLSLGALLVRTAGRVVLVDLGWGPGYEDLGSGGRIGGGDLVANLHRLGVEPADVDTVLFSHLHRDHTGWIVDPASSAKGGDGSGRAAFPKAAHCLSQAEWDYWNSDAPTGPAPSAEQLAVLGTRLSLVADGESPVPGIDVVATPGHTPGHLGFVISSGTERAVVLGDAVHCPIEILQPELIFVADVDPVLAQRTRIHIEQELTQPGTVTAGPHFADLVFGRLMKGEVKPTWHFSGSQVVAVGA